MNTIVIEFSEKDRKLLEGLMGSISLLASVEGAKLPAPARAEVVEAVGPGVEHPVDTSVAHLDPPAPVPEAPAPAPVSLAEFQKTLVTRCAESAAVKEKVQALVQKYAPAVSAIPEDKRAEVLEALKKI